MRGKWNPKTKRYEDSNGNEIIRKSYEGFSKEEIEELREIERIEAEGGTYLERYAKELGVDQGDLFKNILENNSMERFTSVSCYEEFKLLKQTLVKETGLKGVLKEITATIDNIFGSRGPYF